MELYEKCTKYTTTIYFTFFDPRGFSFSDISHNASSLKKSAKLLKHDNILSFFLNS